MTQEQLNLRNKLQQALEAQGFRFEQYWNCETIVTMSKPGDYILKEKIVENLLNPAKYGKYRTERWHEGYSIDICEVYRMNSTEENKSFYLRVMNHRHFSGTSLFSIKVSQSFSDKRINKAIQQAIEAYNQAVANQ